MRDWVAECYELCILHQFAGVYQAPGTFGRWRQGDRRRRWKKQIDCSIGIGSRHRVPARSRCGLFRSCRLSSSGLPGVAGFRQVHSGIPSDFHIGVAGFHRTSAIFANPNAAPPRLPMERREWRPPRILLLHLNDIRSENLRGLLARDRHRSGWECPPHRALHAGSMVFCATACHRVGADRRQACYPYRRPGSLLAVFCTSYGHRNSDHPLVRLSAGSHGFLNSDAPRRGPSATRCPPTGRGLPPAPSG